MTLLRPLFALLVFAAPVLRAEPPPPLDALTFLKTTELTDESRALQTRSTEYRPAGGSGPSVWLIGVAHLGSKEYFQAIQQRLDRQTVVLYEGIGLSDVQKGPGAATNGAGIQSTLASALGLVFQLDAIDYRHARFLNSDLHVPELEKQVRQQSADAGRASSDDSFRQLMDALQGTGVAGEALNQMVGFIGASPQMRETTKLMLVEVLGRAGEFVALAKNLSPEMKELFEVILTQRNAVVVRDLRAQISRLQPSQSVAVFYGAAHMDEIAQRLRDELHYVPVKVEWDTAFTASPAQSTINPAQMRLMLDLMRTQLQQVQPAPVPTR